MTEEFISDLKQVGFQQASVETDDEILVGYCQQQEGGHWVKIVMSDKEVVIIPTARIKKVIINLDDVELD